MRISVLPGLLILSACGARTSDINSPTPVLPGAEAPTQFTRAYGMTESSDGMIRVFARDDRHNTSLFEMRKQDDGSWSDPSELDFPARTELTTPSFSFADGALYYASDADIFDHGKRGPNIWRVAPTPDGWATPEPLPVSINDGAAELSPAMDRQGRLYFTSNGAQSTGGQDIFEASFDDETGDWTVQPFPDGFNSVGDDSHLAVTPDGNRIFFDSHRASKLGRIDIWTAQRSADGVWQMPENLGEPVNTPGIDFGAGLSADGSILFFSRNGELMMISLDRALAGN